MADVDIEGLRQQWVGTVFQEIDLVVDQDRMLEWAVTCGETDPRFIDPAHPDFQASTSFPTHTPSRTAANGSTKSSASLGIEYN